jgi:hypothetical protein
MMYLLQDKIAKSDNFGDIFANFTIINFNYDRYIEYFLFHALRHLYHINENEAANILNKWNKIFHPYGSVGRLPWQEGMQKISFGGAGYGDIWDLSQEIFTYNEQIKENEALSGIREAIVNARRIVFLGFHFHQQNMDLLQTATTGGAVDVIATAVHRATPEIEIISHRIRQMLRIERDSRVQILSNLDCTGLLNQWGTTLLR